MRKNGVSLAHVFDPKNNALNAWRLVLATIVILWHSWPLTGHPLPNHVVVKLLSQVGVDGFFAVSGFLITSSWMRKPNAREYFIARGLRIFPGLWVCLLVTTFVIAPIAVLMKHGRFPSLGSSLSYLIDNGLLNPFHPGIGGTPRDIPWPGVWNGSLWTLTFEMGCYIAVAVLGVLGMLKYRSTIPLAFVLFVCATAFFGYPDWAKQTVPQMLARFAVMFAAGALIYQYRDVIPARWSLIGVSLVIVLAAGWTPNYRVLAAIPLAYLVIASGALIKNINLRNDLSYGMYIYAFPIQQLLVTAGLGGINLFLFFLIATATTIPLAAASWFVVEKRSLALKKRLAPQPASVGT